MTGPTFRSLREDDLADLHVWLNRPHLRRFFQKQPVSLAEVAAKYGPYVRGEEPTHSHLALKDGRPFGYLQCYRIADYPARAETIGEAHGIGVDLAILDPDMLGRGLGRAMLGRYLRDVAFRLFPEEDICFIAQETLNEAGLRNSPSVGFRPLREFPEDGIPTRLLMLERAKIAGFRG